jgi:hypothetical protein
MSKATKSKTYIFNVGADQNVRRGEVGYTLEFADQLRCSENTVEFYKVAGAEPTHEANPRLLASDMGMYERFVPVLTPEVMEEALSKVTSNDTVFLIGEGNSTLPGLANFKQAASLKTLNVDAQWVTYATEKVAEEVNLLLENDIMYVGPKSSFRGLTAYDPVAAEKIRKVAIDGVPTGNTISSLEKNLGEFQHRNVAGQVFAKHFKDTPFIAVIPNAGVPGDGPNGYVTIPAEESYAQGLALGEAMPAGTGIVIAESGPRAARDAVVAKENFGPDAESTTDAMARGFVEAQAKKGATPIVAIDRFKDPLNKNAVNGVNALIAAGNLDNCLLLVVPNDAEGTKYDATLYGPKGKTTMFKSSAVDQDKTGQRQASEADFMEQGIALLSVGPEGQLQGYTPAQAVQKKEYFLKDNNPARNPAVVALKAFGLVNKDLHAVEKFAAYLDNETLTVQSYKIYTPEGQVVKHLVSATHSVAHENMFQRYFDHEMSPEYKDEDVCTIEQSHLNEAGKITFRDYVVKENNNDLTNFAAGHPQLLKAVGMDRLVPQN